MNIIYDKCSKIPNTFFFLFSNKMDVQADLLLYCSPATRVYFLMASYGSGLTHVNLNATNDCKDHTCFFVH